MTDRIKAAELSRRLNVSRSAITQFKKSGRLTFDSDNKIEYAEAVKQLSESESKVKSDLTEFSAEDKETLNHFKIETERWKSLTAELEYLETKRELIKVSVVAQDSARIGKLLKDKLLGIPDRVSSIISGETDELKINEILKKEFKNLLEEIAEQLAKTVKVVK